VEGERPLEAREMGDDAAAAAAAAVGDQKIQRARRRRRAAEAEQAEEDSGEPWCCHFGTSRAQLVEWRPRPTLVLLSILYI